MTKSTLTRRALLGTSLGAAQLALLDRFGSLAPARAECATDGPTRLLVLNLPGGVRFYPIFVPMSDADIATTIPAPMSASGEPIFFRPSDLITLGGDSGGFAPLRMGRSWNPADPGDRTDYTHSPCGYSWVHYDLGPTTAIVHGIDNGSFAHDGAYIGAMCGIAGNAYRAPAMVSVVANHLHRRFSSTRPIPCITINGRGMPQAPGLPAHASPALVPSVSTLASLFSSESSRHRRWRECDQRTATDVPSFDGAGAFGNVGLTTVDDVTLARTRSLRGRGSAGTDRVLEQIYGSYAAISRTLAADVVAGVEGVTPVTMPKPDHLRGYRGMFDMTFGLANGLIDMSANCEWILRLLKSNVTSSVYAYLPERYYDYHSGSSFPNATAATRAQLDIIARLMGEMKATPSPDHPSRSLYDDTVIVVQSEFNRTWPRGPNQDDYDSWNLGDDHNAITSVIVSGGTITGNRQIGGFELPSTQGLPVDIEEEGGGGISSRAPKAADFVATICSQFGMVPNVDFFIPGGYGVIQGLCG
jgi:hypothetical protein